MLDFTIFWYFWRIPEPSGFSIRWVGGQQNAYLCLHRVRGSFWKCLRKQKNCAFFGNYLYHVISANIKKGNFFPFFFISNVKGMYVATTSYFEMNSLETRWTKNSCILVSHFFFRGALCFEWGFTQTFPRNKDATVKLKSELISSKF